MLLAVRLRQEAQIGHNYRQGAYERFFSQLTHSISTYTSDLLKALEDNNDGSEGCAAPLLGVTSYGVSMTTLEEVFLQLEDTSEEEEKLADVAQETVTVRNP